jgi:cob(I)alamin adenosyltransferase
LPGGNSHAAVTAHRAGSQYPCASRGNYIFESNAAMANRLTRIYTRTGDDGSTGLADGSRVAKDHARVQAMGDIDELNSALGLLLSESLPDRTREQLTQIQHRLFDLGGELAIPGHLSLNAQHVGELEQWLDADNDTLPPLKEFILPGGSRAASQCHVARTICRRAERRLVSLAQLESVSLPSRHFLNRLSDFLFVLCRVLNRYHGIADVYWQKPTSS